jgi:hypothetical protein
MIRIRQKFDQTEIADVRAAVREQFARPGIRSLVHPGDRVAVGCGSRGIHRMDEIAKEVIDSLRELKAKPFIVPAMGSHGGAVAEGQVEILRALGITEEAVGCPILSSMETVVIGHAEDFDVRIDKNAAEADGIVVLNRVKAHTSFQGPYESGLMKMMTIGMGKQRGAYICHSKGDDFMSHRISLIGNEVIKKANVVAGVALLENAFDDTYKVVVLPAEQIPAAEPKLLEEAKAAMGRIRFPSCDILMVQKIGKNYSGSGADPNIVGRCGNLKLKMGIDSKVMIVSELSDESDGNATGMGRFDIGTRKFFEKVSFDHTYPNAITDQSFAAYKVPMIVDSDEESLHTGIAVALGIDQQRPRIVIVKNSLEVESILASESMIPEVEQTPGMRVEGEPFELTFDKTGNLLTEY